MIGKGGTVIRATREQTGASVQVSKDEISAGLREVTLSGTPAQIETARALITTQIEAKKSNLAANPSGSGGSGMGGPGGGPGSMTTVMQVESGKIGGLIGKRGASSTIYGGGRGAILTFRTRARDTMAQLVM